MWWLWHAKNPHSFTTHCYLTNGTEKSVKSFIYDYEIIIKRDVKTIKTLRMKCERQRNIYLYIYIYIFEIFEKNKSFYCKFRRDLVFENLLLQCIYPVHVQ